MLDTPQIIQTTPQATAFIRLTIPRPQMPAVFGPAVQELLAVLGAQGVAPVGPVFAHHLRIAPEVFDFELGLPVAVPVTAAGRVQPGRRPPARSAQTVYHGPYEGLPAAWEEFMRWVAARGLQPAEDVWETYVTGPHSHPDPADWRTELRRPLLG